ncbi:MAG TPA: hypothetical protein VHB46_07590 [Burkholderiales bacterium]|nr:hypothetical protein [Burkholderiales bacterium]
MQNLIVYLIVAVALGYAIWLFLPRGGRQWLLAQLIAFAPQSTRARLEQLRADPGSAGCSTCKGCEEAPAETSAIKTIRIHRH